jgi:hypothetical protein
MQYRQCSRQINILYVPLYVICTLSHKRFRISCTCPRVCQLCFKMYTYSANNWILAIIAMPFYSTLIFITFLSSYIIGQELILGIYKPCGRTNFHDFIYRIGWKLETYICNFTDRYGSLSYNQVQALSRGQACHRGGKLWVPYLTTIDRVPY